MDLTVSIRNRFSRNHNMIAESLLSVNEQSWYQDWHSLNDEQKKK